MRKGKTVVFEQALLSGKVAVITGAGTGIGAGIAEAFAAVGASVVVGYFGNSAGADQVVARIESSGGKAFALQCDVREYDQIQALFDRTIEAYGRVDAMINNSGITDPHPLLELTPEQWDRTLDINLRGAFFCTQRAAKEMIKQGTGGSVVNLSSVHGYSATPLHAHYEASKGGINMLTKSCAIELAPYGIRVNAIAPGIIEVERYHSFPNYDRDAWGSKAPIGRVGMPEDIAPLAVFLCSEGAAYLTSQTIWVDGGLTSRMVIGD
jgi:NAD(P)-dependent dehydrogenase (short-subunit alcohol dehydrogenase family)